MVPAFEPPYAPRSLLPKLTILKVKTRPLKHNSLNQYTSKENNTVPIQGTVDSATTTVTVAGGSASAGHEGRYWADEVTAANTSAPWTGPISLCATKPNAGGDYVHSASITAQIAKALQSFTYDLDGNLFSDGLWDYQYDAENRLIRMETSVIARGVGIPHRILDYRYDYKGRRVQKRVVNGATSAEISSRRYLYEGWNLIAEWNAPGGTSLGTLVRTYTWGLDLTGSRTKAGGVGALLQITDQATGKTYLPAFDGNGNVAALLNGSTGVLAAAYEYDASGNLLRNEVIDATIADQPFKFSTKFTDQETGLAYFGYRYYSANLGRFINRDPIEESGGLNLYGFCGNDGINGCDVLGQDPYFHYSWYGEDVVWTKAQYDLNNEYRGRFSNSRDAGSGGLGGFLDSTFVEDPNLYNQMDGFGSPEQFRRPPTPAPVNTQILSSKNNSDGSITYTTTTGNYTVTPAANSDFDSTGLTQIGGAHLSVAPVTATPVTAQPGSVTSGVYQEDQNSLAQQQANLAKTPVIDYGDLVSLGTVDDAALASSAPASRTGIDYSNIPADVHGRVWDSNHTQSPEAALLQALGESAGRQAGFGNDSAKVVLFAAAVGVAGPPLVIEGAPILGAALVKGGVAVYKGATFAALNIYLRLPVVGAASYGAGKFIGPNTASSSSAKFALAAARAREALAAAAKTLGGSSSPPKP